MTMHSAVPDYYNYRVFLEGEDVTEYCVFADDVTGEVRLEQVAEILDTVDVFDRVTGNWVGIQRNVPRLKVNADENGVPISVNVKSTFGAVTIKHIRDLEIKVDPVIV